jgi:hypothetical protein
MFSSGERNWSLMRVTGAAAVTAMVVALGHAGVASAAQDLTMCGSRHPVRDPADPAPFQRIMAGKHIGFSVLSESAEQAVGAQFGGLWVNDARAGWSVAIAPGALDAEAAKTTIEAVVAGRLSPEDAAFVNDRLSVWATPYAEADLRGLVNELFEAVQAMDQGWGFGAGIECVPGGGPGGSDAYLVSANVYTGDVEPSPELLAQAQALKDAHPGRVHDVTVTKGDGRVFPAIGIAGAPLPVPASPGAAPALKVADYVSLPKANRCVRRHTLTVKARKRDDLKTVAIKAPTRKVTLRAGKSARIRLRAHKSKLSLTVTTRGGQTATQAITFRRC